MRRTSGVRLNPRDFTHPYWGQSRMVGCRRGRVIKQQPSKRTASERMNRRAWMRLARMELDSEMAGNPGRGCNRGTVVL